MLDWLGQALALPEPFLACAGLGGGGVIQGTASEASLVALLSARARLIRQQRQQHPDWTETAITGQLVAYCSGQSTQWPCWEPSDPSHKLGDSAVIQLTSLCGPFDPAAHF